MNSLSKRTVASTSLSLIAASVLGGVLLVGCGGDKAAENAPPSNGSTGKMTPATPPASAGSKKSRSISPAKTSEFHNELPKGLAEYAKELGWGEIIDLAPQKEDDYAGQVQMAQDVIQKRPDAISVCGINPQALDKIVAKAYEAKIPIFVHNQITTIKGDVVSYIGYDEREGGKLCGEKAAELLKVKYGDYKGEVALLDGEPDSHTNERAGGFKEAFKKYPNIKVDAEQNGKWDRATGANTTKDWLQRVPRLDLVFWMQRRHGAKSEQSRKRCKTRAHHHWH